MDIFNADKITDMTSSNHALSFHGLRLLQNMPDTFEKKELTRIMKELKENSNVKDLFND